MKNVFLTLIVTNTVHVRSALSRITTTYVLWAIEKVSKLRRVSNFTYRIWTFFISLGSRSRTPFSKSIPGDSGPRTNTSTYLNSFGSVYRSKCQIDSTMSTYSTKKTTKSLSKQLCKGDGDLFQEFSHARISLLSFSISQDSSTTGRNEDKDANKLLYNFLFPYYAYEKITKYTSCKHFQIWALLVLLISLLDFVVLSKSLIAVTSGNPTCYFSRSLCWLLQDKISLKADVNFILIA